MAADKPWLVTNLQTVDGIEMIKLESKCSGFRRFVAGSSKRFGNMTFMDKLRAMRTKATFDACNEGIFDVPLADHRARKAQKDKYVEAGIPQVVEIKLPSAEGFEACFVKVVASLDVRTGITVELKDKVLDHIAALMRESRSDDNEHKMKVGRGVRWCSTRKAFLATRHGDRKRMRTFRPDDDEEDEDIARQDAKDRALAWAAKEEDTPDGDEDGEETGSANEEEDDA